MEALNSPVSLGFPGDRLSKPWSGQATERQASEEWSCLFAQEVLTTAASELRQANGLKGRASRTL